MLMGVLLLLLVANLFSCCTGLQGVSGPQVASVIEEFWYHCSECERVCFFLLISCLGLAKTWSITLG